MSLPTLEQYRAGSTVWRREHRGVTYTLNHHGISSYSSRGIWCYYLHLLENMFQRAEDFALFNREPEVTEYAGSKREHYDYYSIPDLEFHGGVTFYSKDGFMDRDGNRFTALKIGCDYNHLWDEESGYWQGMEDVARDAMRSIDLLVDQFPMNERCAYSGKIADPSEFYTAVNGCRVHKSKADQFEDGWAAWLPAETEAVSA